MLALQSQRARRGGVAMASSEKEEARPLGQASPFPSIFSLVEADYSREEGKCRASSGYAYLKRQMLLNVTLLPSAVNSASKSPENC